MCGLALVRADGSRVPRWQAGVRGVLAWLHGALLAVAFLVLTGVFQYLLGPQRTGSNNLHLLVTLVPTALYPVFAVWLPRRPPHDRLARTYLVPK